MWDPHPPCQDAQVFFFFLLLDTGKASSYSHLPVAGTVLGTRHPGREKRQRRSMPPLCARLTKVALSHEGGKQARLTALDNWGHRAQRQACPRSQSGQVMDRAWLRDRAFFSPSPITEGSHCPPPDASTVSPPLPALLPFCPALLQSWPCGLSCSPLFTLSVRQAEASWVVRPGSIPKVLGVRDQSTNLAERT